jgi:hypothetical protein
MTRWLLALLIATGLSAWGLYVLIQGFRGSTGGTDTSAGFTIYFGVGYLLAGGVSLLLVLLLRKKRKRHSR